MSIVTGGARRIGREIALTLARAGHDVAVHVHSDVDGARATQGEIHALGRRCEIFVADFSDEAATAHLVPAVVEAMGGLTHVVHNASHFAYDDVGSFDYAQLNAHMCANAGSAVLLGRRLHEHLAARGARGAMVLLLDQRLWNPNPDYLSYTLSKSGLEMLVRVFAKALAPTLRVVGVAPGLTLPSDLIDDARLARMATMSLTGKTVQGHDVAAAVAFALHNEAVTGSTLMVDAGFHLQPMARDFPFL